MSFSPYTYTVSVATSNGTVDVPRLTNEIRDSAITVAFAYAAVSGDNITLYFKAGLTPQEEILLGQILQNHTGEPLPEPKLPDGTPVVAVKGSVNVIHTGRQGEEIIEPTHNFSDPTTWYQESERVANEILSQKTPGDLKVWKSTHQNWIDLRHGKVHNEFRKRALIPHGYDVVVQGKTMRTAFAASGGDYVVDYAAGELTFFEDQLSPPQVSYSYATTSGWSLAVPDGKIVEVEDAECQFSADVIVNDTIIMCAEAFVPQLGQWVEVARKAEYVSLAQIVDDAKGTYPTIPAIDPTGPRGLPSTMVGFPFRYGTIDPLPYGVRVRFYLENHQAFGGFRATATIYGISYPAS